jgi:hypothetical protein
MRFKSGHKAYNPAPKGNTLAVKHSLHVYRRMLSGGRLDGRTSLHKVLREKEQELVLALGGDPSPQERLIIADAVKTMLYVGTLDEYIMALDGGIVRGGQVVPVIETRTALAAHLRRDLEALGLERRQKVQTLQEILSADHANENGNGKAD